MKKSLINANDSTFINNITNNKEDKNSLTAIDSSENETLNNTETKADTALNAFASNAKDSSKVNQKLGQDSMKTPLASQVNIGEEDFNWATYRYGPVAGVNVASRWMRDVYIPGVSLGVFAEKMLKDRSTLGIKVQYQNIGFRIGQEEMAMSDLDKLNLWVNQARPEIITGNISMISLPITYQFYLNGNKNNSLFASIGVENNLILKESFSFTYRPGNQGIKEWQKSGTFFQPINGLNIGFGKQFTLANNDLVSMKLNFTIPHGEFVGSTRIPVNIMSLEAKYLFFQ